MLLEWISATALSNDLFIPLLPAQIPEEKSPVVVSHSGKPQALCFVGEDSSTGKLECESLKFVDPSKAEEILSFLLPALIEHAHLKKCHTVFFFYDEKSEVAPLVKKTLAAQHWSDPELFIMCGYFDRSFDPPWLHANFRIPPQFSFASLQELTAQQLSDLKEKERKSVFPPTLSPFKHDNYDPEYSLLLIHNGEAIGWLMTRRIKGNLLSYSAIFVQSEFKMMGLAIPLMAESIKRVLKHSTITGAFLNTYVTLSEPYWVDFVNKRLNPLSRSICNILRSYKRVGER